MELNWLNDVARTEGPFATVYLDARHDTAQADREIELRWRDARSTLTDDGADEHTLAALDDAVSALARAENPYRGVRDRPRVQATIRSRWRPIPAR